ncbi:MAG: hypothetical protein ACXU82_01195 [Caulobacteraceae bacterium]
MTLKPSMLAACAGAASLFVLAAPDGAGAAPSPPLAPGVEPAQDFAPARAPYVVTNPTPLYRSPAYGKDNTTGETLQRGSRPEILGEANAGLYLLVGRGGRGVGYAPRSLLCPVALCPAVKG